MRQSVRSHLAAGGAVTSAGILAWSLVAVAAPPPHFNGAITEVRVVRLAAFAQPPAAPSVALLEKFSSNQAQNVVPGSPVVGGAADITTAVMTAPLTFDRAAQPTRSATPAIGATAQSAIAPATTSQGVDLSWLAALEQDPTFGWIGQIIAGAIIFGIIVVGFVADTVVSLWNSIFPAQPAISGASAATAQANTTIAPALTTNSLLSGSAPVTTAKAGPADAAPATETPGKAGVSVPVTSTATTTGTKQRSTDTATSTKDVTETAKTDEASTGPTAASAPEPSASASTSGPAKPTVRPATPQPVVRGSLGVGGQLRDLPHRDNGGHHDQKNIRG